MLFSSFLVSKLPGQTGSDSVADSVNILVMPFDDILLVYFRLTDGLNALHVALICTGN